MQNTLAWSCCRGIWARCNKVARNSQRHHGQKIKFLQWTVNYTSYYKAQVLETTSSSLGTLLTKLWQETILVMYVDVNSLPWWCCGRGIRACWASCAASAPPPGSCTAAAFRCRPCPSVASAVDVVVLVDQLHLASLRPRVRRHGELSGGGPALLALFLTTWEVWFDATYWRKSDSCPWMPGRLRVYTYRFIPRSIQGKVVWESTNGALYFEKKHEIHILKFGINLKTILGVDNVIFYQRVKS